MTSKTTKRQRAARDGYETCGRFQHEKNIGLSSPVNEF